MIEVAIAAIWNRRVDDNVRARLFGNLDKIYLKALLEQHPLYALSGKSTHESHRDRCATERRVAAALYWFWYLRDHYGEGRRWLEAVLDRSTWALPPAVHLLEEHGVPRTESERAFNCGVGMVAAVAPDAADAAVAQLTDAGFPAWVAGEIRSTDDDGVSARLENDYR